MIRDSITGDQITTGREVHHIVISDDGIPVIYLTPSAALLLARQLIDSVDGHDAINILGSD